jgi:hypothetical protein
MELHHMSATTERRWTGAACLGGATFLVLALVLTVGVRAFSDDAPRPVPLTPQAVNPRMPQAGKGAWREHVQLVWNGAVSRLERRRYELFDPFADAGFDIFWEPRHVETDQSGPISGSGVLTWRRAGALRYGREGIMAQYRGDMANGRAHGYGTFVDRSGLRYDGEWVDGLMEGDGQLLLGIGDVYRGGFKAGRLHGHGLYIDAAGRVYEGGFIAGLRDGPAQVAEPNGLTYAGVWIHGSEDPSQRAPADDAWANIYRVQAPTPGPAELAITLGVGSAIPQFCCEAAPVALGYASTSFPDRLEIYPDAPALLEQWRGRANIAVSDPDPFALRRLSFQEYSLLNYSSKFVMSVPLQFGLENRSTRPITIVGGYLDIERSELEDQPALQSIELNPLGPQNTTFSIENYGWSPARNARLRFRFQHPEKGIRTEPIELSIGEISGVQQFSFAPALARFGVRMRDLPRIGQTCKPREETDEACLARIVRSGVFGQLTDYVTSSGRRFGVRAVGQVDYEWTHADGSRRNGTAPFDALVPLGTYESLGHGCEGADILDVDAGRPFVLSENRGHYSVRFPLRDEVAAGTIRRWRIVLDSKKSSQHRMRVVVELAEGQKISSRSISLLLFRPNRYAESVRPFGPMETDRTRGGGC